MANSLNESVSYFDTGNYTQYPQNATTNMMNLIVTIWNNSTSGVTMKGNYIHGKSLDINMTFWEIFGICLAILTLIFVTIGGNLFTIVIFLYTKQYKKNRNCYILSLASADLLRGFLMPVYLLFHLRPQYFIGITECKIFLTLSYFFGDASLLSILLITMDRCWCIFHPFNYRISQSKTRTAILIGIAWIMAFFIYGPAVLLWGTSNFKFSILSGYCDSPFHNYDTFIVILTCLETLIPLCILIGSNAAIYTVLKKRWNIGLRRSVSTSEGSVHRLSGSSKESENSREYQFQSKSPAERLIRTRRFSYQLGTERNQVVYINDDIITQAGRQLCTIQSTERRRLSGSDSQLHLTPVKLHKRRVSFESSGFFRVSCNSNSRTNSPTIRTRLAHGYIKPLGRRKNSDLAVKEILTKQDRKAASALFLIVAVFILCWTPHMILHLIQCYSQIILPYWLIISSRWLLMANAGINPFLYATGNTIIQKTLKSWVTPCRNESSQDKYYYVKSDNGNGSPMIVRNGHSSWTG